MIRLCALLFIAASLVFSACSNYGKKVKEENIEVYYKGDISEELARRTAHMINELDANSPNSNDQKSFQLLKENGRYTCKMVVADPSKASMDKLPAESFQIIGSVLCDSVFSGVPVDIDLTDNRFKSIRLIPYKKIDLESLPPAE